MKNTKIVVPLKYLSNFRKSLEIPLINYKIHLELNKTKNCVMSNFAGNTEFKITNTKLYLHVVTLSTKDNVKFTKQLNEGFKRSAYWNQHKTQMKSRNLNNINPLRIILDASFQGVKRIFALAYLLLLMLLIIPLTILLTELKETVI